MANPATASVMRSEFSSTCSILYGGYPSLDTLLTRSSARSKWSNPNSSGELNSDNLAMAASPHRARHPVEPAFGTRRHHLFGDGVDTDQASVTTPDLRHAVAKSRGTPYAARV